MMAARLAVSPHPRLAALSSLQVAPPRAPPSPGHPGADDPLRVVPEARQKAERMPLFSGLLTRLRNRYPPRARQAA
jgi:hypothetical protein